MDGRRILIKGIALFCLRLSVGLISASLGPTLTDLTYLFKTNYEAISTALALRGFGLIPGSLLADSIVKKCPSLLDITLSVSHLICFLGAAVSPFVVYVQLFWVIWTVVGVALGVFHVVCFKVILKLWKENINTHVQIQTLALQVGGIFAPIVANPFLVNKDESPPVTKHPPGLSSNFSRKNLHSFLTDNRQWNKTLLDDGNYQVEYHETSVQYVFLLIGAVSVVAFLPWGILSLKELKFERPSVEEPESEPLTSSGIPETEEANESNQTAYLAGISDKVFKTVSILFTFCLFSLYFIFASFIRSFSADHFDIDRNTASLITTTFMIGIAVSALVSCSLSYFISLRTSFSIFAVFQFFSILFWVYLTSNNLSLHWVGTTLIALFVVAAVTTVVAFVKENVSSTDRFLSAYVISRGIADLLFLWLTGRLYDQYGSDVLYPLTLPLSICTLLFASAMTLISIYCTRYRQYHVVPPDQK